MRVGIRNRRVSKMKMNLNVEHLNVHTNAAVNVSVHLLFKAYYKQLHLNANPNI